MVHPLPPRFERALATYVVVPLLEVLAGVRPITVVAARVSPALALRIHARAGVLDQAPAYGSVSVHAVRRPGQALELWGTVQIAGQVYGFAGRVHSRPSGWRVTDFDVLVPARI
ncbi:MAG: Rv3235 family protein [Actinomycetota bacterium]|nr:Rv3235 family protein [Actinomycetota bacterium]